MDVQAGHRLVVLEVESSKQCQSGLGPEAEIHWEQDKKAALQRCANLKHVFARTARDSPDVIFLQLEVCFWDRASLAISVACSCSCDTQGSPRDLHLPRLLIG